MKAWLRTFCGFGCLSLHCLGTVVVLSGQDVAIDSRGYQRDCGVEIGRDGSRIVVGWKLGPTERAQLVVNLDSERPLIEKIGLSPDGSDRFVSLLQDIRPAIFLTVGTRTAPPGRPPDMSVWNVFFDKPSNRAFHTDQSRLELRRARWSSEGRRASLALGDLRIGNFSGELVFTFYSGAPLLHCEAVVVTEEDRRAILYDFGFLSDSPHWTRMAWLDANDQWQQFALDRRPPDQALTVRHRTIIAEGEAGSVACFPPPHQFLFPRDLTDNLKYVWTGTGHQQPANAFGFGIRQDPAGGGGFVPWFNAPPGTRQRLGVFLLLTKARAPEALQEVLKFTHGDQFAVLPGHITFTSHFHMAVAVTAMKLQTDAGGAPGALPIPDFVSVFQRMGVNAVHLADFHGDGHQKDPGPLRLPELEALFAECRRLSNRDFLLIPGEEVNDFLGLSAPGRHPGHWMSLFPKPIYWVMQRKPEEPFAEPHPRLGTLYRVGERADMMELLRREGGLAWAAHPRIKASSWTPDIFRKEDFYLADLWLGGAWKPMPADLSRERLGERALDLLSDMSNWGQQKLMLGEVDTFKIEKSHELYGHMNINYVRLDRLPRYEEGWQPLLKALRDGKFFVTTGEVLIREFTVNGAESGLTVKLNDSPEVRVRLDWTFPLRFAEIISGDGQQVYRERTELADTTAFEQRTLILRPRLTARKWVRLEVWDVACNGAFTQPVWLE